MSRSAEHQKSALPEGVEAGDDTLVAGNGGMLSPTSADSSIDPLWTPEQAARRLNVSPDWVRDHSSRKEPRLPVIRLGGGPGRAGLLRYRRSAIEIFIDEMERRSNCKARRL